MAISCISPRGIYIFFGGDPPDSIPDMFFAEGLQSVATIDLDGDHINEYILYSLDWSLDAGGIYFYKGFTDSIASIPYDSLPIDSIYDGLTECHMAYIDSDGFGDLVYNIGIPGDGPEYRFFSGLPTLDKKIDWQYGVNNNSFAFGGYDLIDFTGDGHLDICMGMFERGDTIGCILVFRGPDFGDTPDIVMEKPDFIGASGYGISEFPVHISNIGDFNGDGWSDLGVKYVDKSQGLVLVFCGGPNADTLYDFRMEGPATSFSFTGDMNGDGYDDLICGGAGSWEGIVFLYAGGPNADTIPDATISSLDLPPRLLNEIGWRVSLSGDVNGDGFDDAIFSCKNFGSNKEGDVFVIAGSSNLISLPLLIRNLI